jgi:RNA polymerase sigma factor (sigma-70 family)
MKVREQIRRLTARLRHQGKTPEDAEDLVQEAFLRMALYCEEGNEVRSPSAFLARTVHNLAINSAERERVRAAVPEPIEDLDLVDSSPPADEVVAAEECLRRVQQALTAVSARTRDVFFMHRLQGMSYAEIAEHFDLSISAVEKHVAKAMAVLGPKMHELYKELQR